MSCNITFNPRNERHRAAAEYMDMIPARRKTAFIVHLLETYRESHPYGPNWEEVDEIMKSSRSSYTPKVPILENIESADRPSKIEIQPDLTGQQEGGSVRPSDMNKTEDDSYDILSDLKELGIL